MPIPSTGNIIVDKTLGAKKVSRSGNQALDRTLNENTAEGVQRTGNNLLDRAIHGDDDETKKAVQAVRGGNTLLSVNSKKGAAMANDRPENLLTKRLFKRGRYAGKEDES